VCVAGYTGTATTISCSLDGLWTVSSGCSLVDCQAPSQTGYTFQFSSTTYLPTASASCAFGYAGTLANSGLVICQANGNWDQASGCTQTTTMSSYTSTSTSTSTSTTSPTSQPVVNTTLTTSTSASTSSSSYSECFHSDVQSWSVSLTAVFDASVSSLSLTLDNYDATIFYSAVESYFSDSNVVDFQLNEPFKSNTDQVVLVVDFIFDNCQDAYAFFYFYQSYRVALADYSAVVSALPPQPLNANLLNAATLTSPPLFALFLLTVCFHITSWSEE